ATRSSGARAGRAAGRCRHRERRAPDHRFLEGTSMIPATERRDAASTRLLHLDPGSAQPADHAIGDLAVLLRDGDLLVVNDAATLPASLGGHAGGVPVEVRLCGQLDCRTFRAVLFG